MKIMYAISFERVGIQWTVHEVRRRIDDLEDFCDCDPMGWPGEDVSAAGSMSCNNELGIARLHHKTLDIRH